MPVYLPHESPMTKTASMLAFALCSCASHSSLGPAPDGGAIVGGSDDAATDWDAIGGDGASGSTAPPWRSGARLRARVLDGGDGAALFKGWTDMQLGVSCSYRLAADNELRCLPDAASG